MPRSSADVAGVSVAIAADAGPVELSADSRPASPADGASPFATRAIAFVPPAAAGAGLLAIGLGRAPLLEGLRGLQGRLAALLGRVPMLAAFLGLGAAPLFSRIRREGVLDNPARARVHDAIAQEPGLSLSDVAQRAGIAWGTAVHHLRRLEGHGLIVSARERSHRRFFVANTPAAAQRRQMAVVIHPTARRIAEFVSHRPGTNQAGICQALGLNNPAASKHLGHFESEGLVLSQRSGRSRVYHATSGLHVALGLLEPAQSARAVAHVAVPAQASERALVVA